MTEHCQCKCGCGVLLQPGDYKGFCLGCMVGTITRNPEPDHGPKENE